MLKNLICYFCHQETMHFSVAAKLYSLGAMKCIDCGSVRYE